MRNCGGRPPEVVVDTVVEDIAVEAVVATAVVVVVVVAAGYVAVVVAVVDMRAAVVVVRDVDDAGLESERGRCLRDARSWVEATCESVDGVPREAQSSR